jgi:hypothetical protein
MNDIESLVFVGKLLGFCYQHNPGVHMAAGNSNIFRGNFSSVMLAAPSMTHSGL